MEFTFLIFACATLSFEGATSQLIYDHEMYAYNYRCYEGFNATILGLPIYHWEERHCYPCFMQELTFPFLQTEFNVNIRYGGCMPSELSESLSCEKLFGENSDLKPETIINMIPVLDSAFRNIEQDFYKTTTYSFRILLSNGTYALRSFIDGCYTFLSNLGLDTTKADPLKRKLQKVLDYGLPRDRMSYSRYVKRYYLEGAVEDLLISLFEVTAEYEADYPNAEMPKIIWRIFQYVNTSYYMKRPDCYEESRYMTPYGYRRLNYTAVEICRNEYRRKLADLNTLYIESAVDLQYAISDALDFKYLDIYEVLRKAFPDFEIYIRFLQMFDRQEMKELTKDLYKVAMIPTIPMRRYDALLQVVDALNKTMTKFSDKFEGLISDMRSHFAPKTCKLTASPDPLANIHGQLSDVEEMEISGRDRQRDNFAMTNSHRGDSVAIRGSPVRNIAMVLVFLMFV